jgi:ATP-dependent DNA ligase
MQLLLDGSGLLLKLENQQEFVIGGYRPGSNGVDALLVGYYDETGLRFAGKVRSAELEVFSLGRRRDG